jgi:hypothetical protein
MKMKLQCLFIVLAMIAGIHSALAQTYTLLHIFVGGLNDGANPVGSLTLSNGTFYGLASGGGLAGGGVIDGGGSLRKAKGDRQKVIWAS